MATRTNNPVFESGLVLSRRYRLDEPLATGGMAEVWKGHDTVLQRPVAVKLLHPHLASEAVVIERFRREAISAARLAHPHIVPTYDTGTDEGTAFIIMSLVEGSTLRDVINAGSLSLVDTVTIGRQVADALAHAHSHDLIHRDMKPTNVLVVDDTRRVLVADFGIAKAVENAADASLTLPGLVVGTPAYSAPEQLSGADVDARADIFAAGVLLHEMICGHTDVEYPTELGLSPSDANDSEPICPDLPRDLAPIVAKATSFDRDARYQTAAQLRDALFDLERRLTPIMVAPMKDTTTSAALSKDVKFEKPEDNTRTFKVEPATAAHAATEASLSSPQPATAVGAEPAALPNAPKPRKKSTRLRNISVVVAVLLVISAVALGRMVAGLSAEEKPGTGGAGAVDIAATPATGVTASTFDPFGDGIEHPEDVAAAVDDDPSTSWSTERYNDPRFAGLKPGVGLIVNLSKAQTLTSMRVGAQSNGWAAQIYVSDQPGSTLASWGEVVDTQSGLGTDANFDLHGRTGSSVLLWITDLGNQQTFSASEVDINSRP